MQLFFALKGSLEPSNTKRGGQMAPLSDCTESQVRDRLFAFEAHGDPHAPTNAKSGEAFFGVAALHLEQ